MSAVARCEAVCRMCGCTDEIACEPGEYWIEPDLCSSCAPPEPDVCGVCGAPDCTRLGGLVLCSEPTVTREDGDA